MLCWSRFWQPQQFTISFHKSKKFTMLIPVQQTCTINELFKESSFWKYDKMLGLSKVQYYIGCFFGGVGGLFYCKQYFCSSNFSELTFNQEHFGIFEIRARCYWVMIVNNGVRIALWIAFSLCTQRPRVRILALPIKFLRKNCRCCQGW